LTSSQELNLRFAISPPSGETFVHSRGGMCMKSYSSEDDGTCSAMHIGNFDATDEPLVTAAHVDGEKIFFEASRTTKGKNPGKTVKFTGQFTAQLA